MFGLLPLVDWIQAARTCSRWCAAANSQRSRRLEVTASPKSLLTSHPTRLRQHIVALACAEAVAVDDLAALLIHLPALERATLHLKAHRVIHHAMSFGLHLHTLSVNLSLVPLVHIRPVVCTIALIPTLVDLTLEHFPGRSDLEPLIGAPKLERLALPGLDEATLPRRPLRDTYAALARLPHLRYLSLCGGVCPQLDILHENQLVFDHLIELDLSAGGSSQRTVHGLPMLLECFPRLETLATKAGTAFHLLRKFAHLKTLSVHRLSAPLGYLAADIAACANLTQLTLTCQPIDPSDWTTLLRGLRQLERLHFYAPTSAALYAPPTPHFLSGLEIAAADPLLRREVMTGRIKHLTLEGTPLPDECDLERLFGRLESLELREMDAPSATILRRFDDCERFPRLTSFRLVYLEATTATATQPTIAVQKRFVWNTDTAENVHRYRLPKATPTTEKEDGDTRTTIASVAWLDGSEGHAYEHRSRSLIVPNPAASP